jgi:glucose/mannose transport system permease protein
MSGRMQTDIGRHLRSVGTRRIALYVVLVGVLLFYLTPLESGIATALKGTDAVTTTAPFAPPITIEWFLVFPYPTLSEGFDLAAVETAIDTLSPVMPLGEALPFLSGIPFVSSLPFIGGPLLNSVILAVPATLLSAAFGSLAAYGLTLTKWRGQVAVVVIFMAGIFIPYQAVLVPLSRFWAIVDIQQIGRFGELFELIVTHTAYGIPITTILFRSYYQNISREMLEAARLDGASTFSIYRNIVFPLSTPMFAVTLIYQFTQIWNDFLFALILTNTQSAFVITRGLNALTGGIVQSFNTQMAGAFIAAFPTLLVYIFFGEKFAEGVAAQ